MKSDEYTLKNETAALPGGAQGGKTAFWEICRNTGLPGISHLPNCPKKRLKIKHSDENGAAQRTNG